MGRECPVHGGEDNTQSVSAVVDSGKGIEEGQRRSMQGDWDDYRRRVYTSQIAIKLEEPKKPPGVEEYFGFQASCMAFVYSLAPFLVSLYVISSALLPSNSTPSEKNNNLTIFVVLASALITIPFFVYLARRGERSDLERWKQRKRDYEENILPAWERAMEKWKRSRYCYSDHIVYDPLTNDSCDPDGFLQYLYR